MKKLTPLLRRLSRWVLVIYLCVAFMLSGFIITSTIRDLFIDEEPTSVVPIDDGTRFWVSRTYPLSWVPYGQIVRFNYKWENLWKKAPSLDEVRGDLLFSSNDSADSGEEFIGNFQKAWAPYAEKNQGFARNWLGSWRNWFMLILAYPILPGLPILALCGLIFLPRENDESRRPPPVWRKAGEIIGVFMRGVSSLMKMKGETIASPLSVIGISTLIFFCLGYLGTVAALEIESILKDRSYYKFDPKWHGASEYILFGLYLGIPYTFWWIRNRNKRGASGEDEPLPVKRTERKPDISSQ